MRIAIAARHRDHVGGVETYLEGLFSRLHARGHVLMLLHEHPAGSRPIVLPSDTTTTLIAETGRGDPLAALRAWRPDVVFSHGLERPASEAALLGAAPTVFFLHTYHGSCVGGSKTHMFPGPRPCARTLGPGCLLLYFPRRCGGLSPLTMVERYRLERARRDLLGRYAAVTVLSTHMQREALAHGADAAKVTVLPPPVDGVSPERVAPRSRPEPTGPVPLRLLFLGRLEPAKGGDVLIRAALACTQRLDRRIEVTFVGDGQQRDAWEALGRRCVARDPRLAVSFAGRADGAQRRDWFAWADLLVVPSLWPEPFGLVGAEAAAAGLPAVAFDVGGVREWLDDGRTGRLAPGGRLDADALAAAVAWAVGTPGRLAELSSGALRKAAGWSVSSHVGAVERVLSHAAGDRFA